MRNDCIMMPLGKALRCFYTVLLLAFLGACASYPVNPQLAEAPGDVLEAASLDSERSGELTLMLSFSGGGTRAAAFAYGVLEVLADTSVTLDGRKRRLIDEVDLISSVSGGSFTSAYYGLYGDRIFQDFEYQFLKRNVQGMLVRRMFWPGSWPKLWSLFYNRSELAAELYDELLFEGHTFGDIYARKGPEILINATDIGLGAQFSFRAETFAVMCSDLAQLPVSRAVTASSAVPIVFSSLTIHNYAGSCGLQLPDWAVKALRQRRDTISRQYHLARLKETYLDREQRPYIHLFDGGISDNLGIRPLIDTVNFVGDAWTVVKSRGSRNVRRVLIVIVNAATAIDTSIDKSNVQVPLLTTLANASSVPLNQYNFESVALLHDSLEKWSKQITEGRCREARGAARKRCDDLEFELVVVDFHALADEQERDYLLHLPTSFVLQAPDVDRLRAAARKILAESTSFQRFVKNFR